jgi:hypothetical protein
MPAFAPVDNALPGAGVDDDDGVVLVVGPPLLLSLALELVVAAPTTASSRISLPVPQQSMLCVPQHHFADSGVPSQGVITALLPPSTSYN